jgi:hypothetical protein
LTGGGLLGLAVGATNELTTSLRQAAGAAAGELGYTVRLVRSAADEVGLDAVLAVGPPEFYDGRSDISVAVRRIAWFGEPLPSDHSHDELGNGSAVEHRLSGRAIRLLEGPARRLKRLPLPRHLEDVRAAAFIDHECASNLAAALRRARTVDLVVVTSHDRARVLAGHGVGARVVPFGYHQALAGPIVTAVDRRDIAAVAFGSGLSWSSRRARGLRACAERLAASRLVVAPETWGPNRDALLRRSRILLNVHRVPGNFIGLRVILAAAAGAVLVTEPMDDPSPFRPGTHYVEAPLELLAEAAERLLADEPRRRRIVEAGQALLTGPLSMASSLRSVLT